MTEQEKIRNPDHNPTKDKSPVREPEKQRPITLQVPEEASNLLEPDVETPRRRQDAA